jgi:transposase
MATPLNLDITERFESSGLTQKAFALREGISAATLAYHLKRVRETGPVAMPAFSELAPAVSPGQMEIVTPSGTVVRIPL